MKALPLAVRVIVLFAAVFANIFLWPILFLIDFATSLWKLKYHLLSFNGRVGRKTYWAMLPIYFIYGLFVAVGLNEAVEYTGALLNRF